LKAIQKNQLSQRFMSFTPPKAKFGGGKKHCCITFPMMFRFSRHFKILLFSIIVGTMHRQWMVSQVAEQTFSIADFLEREERFVWTFREPVHQFQATYVTEHCTTGLTSSLKNVAAVILHHKLPEVITVSCNRKRKAIQR